MKTSQENAILIKNLYRPKQYGARRLLSELPDKGWKLGSVDSLLKRIRKTGTSVRQPGGGTAVHCVRRVAVDDLILSKEDKPKRHDQLVRFRMKTAIIRSSVHRIIRRDLQLKCFKRCRVQLLSEANCISRLTH